MVKGHSHFLLLGRAACRALPSASSSPLAGEASAAWRASLRSDYGRHFGSHACDSGASADGGPSTSSTANDQASVTALRQPWSLLSRTIVGSRPWHHAPTTSPRAAPTATATAAASSAPSLLAALPRAAHITTPPPPASLRALCVSASAAAEGGGGAGDSSGPAPPAAEAASAPVQNPLQAALAAASGTQAQGPAGAGAGLPGAPVKGRRRERRNWMWYDEADEREERRYERARQQYSHVGTAYMTNIVQSVKKMNRIVRLVRGLPYADAVAQCNLVPHKAARHVLQALEAAYEDATQAVGLDGEKLVVGIIYATRGRVEKAMQRMGRGRSGRMFTRTSHLRVVLRESRERPSGGGALSTMRRVTPLMGVMTGAAAPAAAWLARDPAAAARAAQRPRFAYRLEV